MQVVRSERHREYRGVATNTDIWNSFELRSDDIIVTTPPKCGTTWMLNLAMMLIYGRVVPNAGNAHDAPWLDRASRQRGAIAAAFLDGLERRRCIKSHAPLDGISYAAEPSYIVVYRHPVDAHFSLRSHAKNMIRDTLDFMFPDDESEGFRRFVEEPETSSGTDDFTVASIVHHYREAKARQKHGNVHFFHYADLSRDLPGQVSRLADILGISIDAALRDEIAKANTFKQMRKAAEVRDQRSQKNASFHDPAGFFSSGTSNKWEGRLTADDLASYKQRINTLLPTDDVAWLEWGGRGAP